MFVFKIRLKQLLVLTMLMNLIACVNVTGVGGDSHSGNGGDGINGDTTVDQKPDIDIDVSPLP